MIAAAARTLLVLLAALQSGLPARGQESGLRLEIVQGDGAVTSLEQGTAPAPTVEVRDRNDEPVEGALVVFTLRGRAARMNGGVTTVEMLADASGRASVELTPTAPGTARIEVTAIFLGATATATISQTTMRTAEQAAELTARRKPDPRDAAGPDDLDRPKSRDSSLLAIIGGAGATGAGAILLANSRKNQGPLQAFVTVAGFSGPPGTAIRGLTELTFTANTLSDSEATFAWDFGDGTTASGVSVTHVFNVSGNFRVTVTRSVDDRTTAITVSVADLTADWVSPRVAGILTRLQLTQEGLRVSGRWIIDIDPFSSYNNTAERRVVNSPFEGTLQAPRAIQFQQLDECLRATFLGTVSSDVRTLNVGGRYGNPVCGPDEFVWTFTRQ